MEIWVLSRESGGYGGSSYHFFEEVEKEILGLDHCDFDAYHEIRKTYFKDRKEAEDYALPIAKKMFHYFISDMRDNAEDGEETNADEYEKRGFHMVRQEELKEGDPLYDLCLNIEVEKTSFICPAEHEYDRIGMFYGGISKAILH